LRKLPNVTLFGLDCVDVDRLLLAFEICQKDFDFGQTKLLTSLPTDYKDAIKIDRINSLTEYSKFMIYRLNDYIDTDFVLVVQYDGFILNPDAWTDDYLKYDYIGAPWWENDGWIVGNGGFSLRSKKLLEILASGKYQLTDDDPEDWFIGVTIRKELEEEGIKFAPVELAKQFGFEMNEKEGVMWDGQFGFHGLTWTDISKWLKQHPEYKIENELDDFHSKLRDRFEKNN